MLTMDAFLVGAILFVCFIVVLSILGIKEWSENNSKTKSSVIVSVEKIDRKRSRLTSGRVLNVTPVYAVTFLTSDNERKIFDLSTFDYKWIKEGDYGELTTQGTRFIKFNKIEQGCYKNKS